jgi:hypothetical protein
VLSFKKLISVSAGIVLILACFFRGLLDNTFVNYATKPNLAEKKTVAYSVKKIIVYISPHEKSLLEFVNFTILGSFVIVVLILIIHRGDPFKEE